MERQPHIWVLGRYLDLCHGDRCEACLSTATETANKGRCSFSWAWHGQGLSWSFNMLITLISRTPGSYYRPEGFALGQLGEFQAHGEHMVDDANSTEPNNVAQRVEQFVMAAQRMAGHIEGNDIMFTMGGAQNSFYSLSRRMCYAPCRIMHVQSTLRHLHLWSQTPQLSLLDVQATLTGPTPSSGTATWTSSSTMSTRCRAHRTCCFCHHRIAAPP